VGKTSGYILNELSHFISFPTVSSDEKNKEAMCQCAQWLAQHLASIGMHKTQVYSTTSHPLVFAEYVVHPSSETVLFYGHYDVQPADPIGKWHTDPFKAAIKGDYIFGRGASDDKGQMFIHIKAVERMIAANKALPVNVKFLIEGAEEIGSAGLGDFIVSNKKLLQCDVVVVSDTKMASLNEPAITYSLRGSLNAEIFIQTAKKDLHSGTFGGYVPNAALTLSEFITSLFHNHSVAIPGFYDNVEIPSIYERKFIRANSISDEKLIDDAEVFSSWGDRNYNLHERSTIRPSLSITGITSGFQGKGVKNVIPSVASVKLNFRLVPNQQPEKIRSLLDQHINRMIKGAKLRIVYSSHNRPVVVPRNNPFIKAAANACETVFRKKARFIQNGGTIGAVDFLHTILNVPVILMGFAQASDNMHAPNEKFYLPNFFKGIETIVQFMRNVSLLKNKKYLHEISDY
jgi:acetylornithine deacetylase/succinyl-diaminopimelate desuccinylase-like protein